MPPSPEQAEGYLALRMRSAVKELVARRLLLVSLALLPVLGFEIYTGYDARQVRQQLMEDLALRPVASEQQRIIDSTEQMLNALGSPPAVQGRPPRLLPALDGQPGGAIAVIYVCGRYRPRWAHHLLADPGGPGRQCLEASLFPPRVTREKPYSSRIASS